MASDATGTLEFSAERHIAAPPGQVWSACTSREGLESWWSPEDLRTSVRRLEVRPGGAVAFHVRYVPAMLGPNAADAFRAAGVPIAFDLRGRFGAVEEERLLDFDLTLELGRAGAGVEMRTRLEFAPEGSGTRVTLTGLGKETPHWATLGRQNLGAQLERLANYVEPRTGART